LVAWGRFALRCTCEEQASTTPPAADRQGERAAEYHNIHAQQVVTEHCEIAHAALQLSDMSSLTFADYLVCAAKLDEAAVDYPVAFSVRALLFVAHSQLADGTMQVGHAIDMFSLHDDRSLQILHRPFQALAPRLNRILQLSTDDMERALVQGLFGQVLLHFMASPGGMPAAGLVANALRDSCREATRRGETAAAAHSSAGRSAMAHPCPWITEMLEAADAVQVLLTGDITLSGMHTLHRARSATTGSLKLLAHSIESRHAWSDLAASLYSQHEYHILPDISEALRACALHPALWARAAACIPGWREQTRPGSTQQLEERLWTVLLKAWELHDKHDAASCCSLLERLHLARSLTAPNRPADATLDTMQVSVPIPQLIIHSQSPQPASITGPAHTPPEALGHACLHTHCSAHLGRRRSQPPTMRGCRAS
jgi:hypothetical protein